MEHSIFRILLILFLSSIFMYGCKENNGFHFTRLSANATGIKFKNVLIETEDFNVLEYGYMYNGGGVAVGDINNDGLEDIYFTGNMISSHLYLNKGDFEFDEIAVSAGVDAPGLWNTGVSMIDINNDGYLDIFVARSAAKNPFYRKNLLFVNNGDLTFTEMSESFGLVDTGYTTQALFFDYDGDGDLDLYVLNHSVQSYAGFSSITGQLRDKYDPNFGDRLYENVNGFYINRTKESGIITNVLGFGLGISMGDFNNDNWPDLYISNDYNEPDYLYINNQDGTFKEDLKSYFSVVSMFSMGSSAADINNDGLSDLVTLDMLPESLQRQKTVLGPDNYEKYQRLIDSGFFFQSMRNMLHLNQGGKFFTEVGQLSGISNTDWSWAPLIADFDNDGLKDLFVTNGYKRDYTNMDFINFAVQQRIDETEGKKEIAILDLIEEIPSIVESNYLFKNIDGIRFSDEKKYSGLGEPSISHGAAFADLDNDGDLDLIVNNTEDFAGIFRNNTDRSNTSLQLVLRDSITSNLNGIGAKIDLYVKDKVYTQVSQPVHGFQSSSTNRLHFGVNRADIDSLKIYWADGALQTHSYLRLNLIDTIYRTDVSEVDTKYVQGSPYFFEITQDLELEYVHNENEYNDFKVDRLLPYYLSTQGPKMAKGDVNGDKLEDIYITGSKGSAGELWLQNSNGSFYFSKQTDFELSIQREEVDAIFLDVDIDGDLDLYTVGGSSENTTEDLVDHIYLNDQGKFKRIQLDLIDRVSKRLGSVVLSSDFNLDGYDDLFIGTRNHLDGYPLSDDSFFLMNRGDGRFDVLMHDLGNITNGSIADMDMDGYLDLILVKEWGAVQVIYNHGKGFNELDQTELFESSGLWNTVQIGDFNNDGLPDILAGNFGLNNQFDDQIFMAYADFDLNGSVDPILCVSQDGTLYPFWSKDDLASQLPAIQSNYTSYAEFSKAPLNELLSQLDGVREYQVLHTNTLESSLFLNHGDRQFKRVSLPIFSQISPIFDFVIDDFNKDGNLDFIAGGNLFGTRVRLGRNSSSKVELFFGNGDGTFNQVPYDRSGIINQGEVRALGHIRNKMDEVLLILNNNNSLRAFRSVQ